MLTIGFATQFYTLWDVQIEPVYFTDERGTHHLVRHRAINNYIKNISTDLAKTKEAYPDLTIDEGLRGKTRSFTTERDEDLCPELLKFGKYKGLTVAEVAVKDFGYILWLLENAREETRKVCLLLPEVIQYHLQKEKERQEAMDAFAEIKSGRQEVTFENNPNHRITSGDYEGMFVAGLEPYAGYYYSRSTVADNHQLFVLFKEVSPVSGIYPYNMAVIGGKAKRIKNKTVNIDLNIILTNKSEHGCVQYATINE